MRLDYEINKKIEIDSPTFLENSNVFILNYSQSGVRGIEPLILVSKTKAFPLGYTPLLNGYKKQTYKI